MGYQSFFYFFVLITANGKLYVAVRLSYQKAPFVSIRTTVVDTEKVSNLGAGIVGLLHVKRINYLFINY